MKNNTQQPLNRIRLRVAGLVLTGVTALCPWARHINPYLVLVQLMKARPNITEQIVDWDVKNQIKQKKPTGSLDTCKSLA